ncbi:hypothetical protein BKA81DRAFT_383546 [Phyllosticta paracitricarpa]
MTKTERQRATPWRNGTWAGTQRLTAGCGLTKDQKHQAPSAAAPSLQASFRAGYFGRHPWRASRRGPGRGYGYGSGSGRGRGPGPGRRPGAGHPGPAFLRFLVGLLASGRASHLQSVVSVSEACSLHRIVSHRTSRSGRPLRAHSSSLLSRPTACLDGHVSAPSSQGLKNSTR